MADVTVPAPRGAGDDTRGQLFIVTALTLAVLFVVLALLLNTAIYTENLATRSADPGAGEAIQFRAAADDGVGELIGTVNRHERTDRGTLEAELGSAIVAWSEAVDRHAIARTHSATASFPDDGADIHFGAQIVQTDPAESFEDARSRSDWTVVDDAEDLRSFNMTLQRDGLHVRTSEPVEDTPSETFYIDVSGSSDDWQLYAYVHDEDDDGFDESDPIVVDVRDADGNLLADTCEVDAPRATVDFVAGSVNGGHCSFPSITDELGPDYDVEYENADSAFGTYLLIVDETLADVEDEDDGDDDRFTGDHGHSPFLAHAIWDTEINVTFSTPDAYYATEFEVEPGDGDE